MEQYLTIAREYFRAFEGLAYYPGPRQWTFWAWLVALVGFASGIYWYMASIDVHGLSLWSLVPVMVTEVVLLFIGARIHTRKEREVVVSVNRALGADFSSVAECKRHLLSKFLGVPSAQFLVVAEEIGRLQHIGAAVQLPYERALLKKWRFVVDPAAKDRVANWALAFCAALLAVAVSGDAKLETLFEVFADRDFQKMMWVVFVLAILGFVIWLGLQILAMFMRDVAMLWLCKVSRSRRGGMLELNYMMRDLARFHRRVPLSVTLSSTHGDC